MKLLMFQARHFEFAPQTPDPPPVPNRIDAVTVVFIHAEAHDVCNQARLARKAARHVKWLCNKRGLTNIALHSFAHLSESKAPVEFGEWFISGARRTIATQRLPRRNDPLRVELWLGIVSISRAHRQSLQDSVARPPAPASPSPSCGWPGTGTNRPCCAKPIGTRFSA